MRVVRRRVLCLRFPQHVGVARVEAVDAGALVAGRPGREQVIAKAQEDHVPVEGRPIFLADHHEPIRGRDRMRAAAGYEELVVEDAVVLVGDQLVHHILILAGRHQHQVLERVVQVPSVVHVHVGGAAVPAERRHVGHRLQFQGHRRHLARLDLHVGLLRPVLESLHGLDVQFPGGHFDLRAAGAVEHMLAGPLRDPRVRIGRRVELAVRGGQVNPRRRDTLGARVERLNRDDAHRRKQPGTRAQEAAPPPAHRPTSTVRRSAIGNGI